MWGHYILSNMLKFGKMRRTHSLKRITPVQNRKTVQEFLVIGNIRLQISEKDGE